MDNSVKVLLALAAGAAVGAALGILFAPAKGDETRELIAKKGKELADEVVEKFKSAKDGVGKKEGVLN